MRRIAEPVDRLIEDLPGRVFDVAVVGSGYGGAVAARRCAEAGLSVVVLERGKEYLPGEFPRESAAAPGHFRIDAGGDTTLGYDDALYDVRVGPEMVVVAGSGLGGGSLVNAGVALAPERAVFAQPAWPVAIRGNVDDLLARYPGVRAELAAMPYARDAARAVPAKTLAFEAFARCARGEARAVPITVNTSTQGIPLPGGTLQPCIGCGDCVAGCNYGAKATLGMTYLAAAHAAGARLFTNACVLQVAPHAQGWQVALTRTTDQRSYQRALAHEATATDPAERQALAQLRASLTFGAIARIVVLAAGAVGSTEILQRSRESGLGVSRALGTRFSGNGDSLSFGYWQRDPVHAVGWGNGGNQVTPGPHVVGPTITRALHAGDDVDVNDHFVVEDAAIPGALAGVFHEIVTNAAILHQLDGWTFKGADPLARTVQGAQHTQTFLTMGHDGSRGELRYGAHGRTRIHWPTLAADTRSRRYDATISAVGALGATYLPNPLNTPIPRSLEWALAHVQSGGRGVTVHPLGGCPMGDDGASGVVDERGAVFLASGTTRTHPGLYVLDGAIIPTSLGTNPFLTIAVLAERAMPALIAYARSGRGDREVAPGSSPTAVTVAIPALPVCRRAGTPLTLHEVLRGELVGVHDGQSRPLATRLDVALPTADMEAFLADPQHRFETARARLQMSPIGQRPRLLDTWHYEEATGLVTILEPVPRALPLRILDTLQALATLVIERAADEMRERIAGKLANCLLALARLLRGERATGVAAGSDRRPQPTPMPGPFRLFLLVLRLAWHAADRRQMRYEFALRLRDGAVTVPASKAGVALAAPRGLLLSGRKDIRYAADWSALASYALRWLAVLPRRLLRALAQSIPATRDRIAEPVRPRLARRNVWQTMTELHVRLAVPNGDRDKVFASGTLAISPLEIRDERPPQLHGEATAGILGVAGYGALFARYLLKCRLFDFRLPNYRPMPDFPYARASGEGAASRVHFAQRLPLLRDAQGTATLVPECHAFDVPRRAGSNEQVGLVLWRYRNKVEFRDTRDGMRQARSILLVHAFGQSAVSFAEPTQDVNLAEFLHRRGWDVWLIEHRISIGLPSASQQCSMDEIARFDLPVALRRCLHEIAREHPEASGRPLQMFALAQCVGAASLAMSILGGELAAGGVHAPTATPPEHVGYQSRHRSLLAGVVLSQFTPYVIGDAGSQVRSFLPGLLRDATNVATIRFDAPADTPCVADDAKGGAADGYGSLSDPITTLLDRCLATLPRDAGEHCWDEFQGRAATQVHASCRRMWGIEAPLFSHRQLSRATHDRLPLLLATANLGVFLQARHCVEQERLVDADGLNVYVTDGNIQRHLHMPVAFAHGRRNALFSVGSSRRSYLMLGNVFPKAHMERRVRLIVFKDYGHLDWLIGKRAHVETYPRVGDFLDLAWQANAQTTVGPPSPPEPRVGRGPLFQLAVPAMGPIVGHVARSDDEVRVNVWLRANEDTTTPARFALVAYRGPHGHCLTLAAMRHEFIPLASRRGPTTTYPSEAPFVPVFDRRYAIIELRLPHTAIPADGDLSLEAFTVHPLPGWKVRPNPTVDTLLAALVATTPNGPHGDPVDTWRHLLEGAEARGGSSRFEVARDALARRLAAGEARRQRTARTTLSRTRLARVQLADAVFRLTRAFFETPDAPTKEIALAATCCRHPGSPVEGERVDATYRRLLAASRPAPTSVTGSTPLPLPPPAALFLVGDQIYADATAGLLDPTIPLEKYEERYRGLLTAPDARRLLASVPTYMAIDDHEIADDWDRSQAILDPPLVDMAIGMARVHQWSHSSAADLTPAASRAWTNSMGLVHTCRVGGEIPAIVLDTRSLRRARDGPRSILSRRAWNHLLHWLDAHRDEPSPKLIVTGSPVAPGFACHLDAQGCLDPASAMTADNWQAFAAERTRLFDEIRTRGMRHVVLLSGDYHCAALATIHHGEQPVATAVVAPPAYAPLRYANAPASALALAETCGGYSIRLASTGTDDQGIPCRIDGSGYARLHFARRDGAWRLRVAFDVCAVCDGADMQRDDAWRQVVAEIAL